MMKAGGLAVGLACPLQMLPTARTIQHDISILVDGYDQVIDNLGTSVQPSWLAED